jgi:D-alanyl-D-alanine carboxypeptidase
MHRLPVRPAASFVLVIGLALVLAGVPSSVGGATAATMTTDTSAASVTADTTPPCDADCQAITTGGKALVDGPGGPPGTIVLVDRNGSTAEYSFGTAEVGQAEPITPTTHLRLASVSKMYSGAVALALVARGELRLSDPVGRWVRDLPAAWRPVTLAELLQHTSGLPDFIRTSGFVDDITANPYDPPSRFGLVRLAFDTKPAFRPGSSYAYSNTDNELVALMVQGVAHRSYEHELAALVTGPLGLDQTSLPQTEDLPTPYAHGYQVAVGAVPDDVTNGFSAGWSWASGGIVSTPTDVDRFVRAYVSGSLTTPAAHARQFSFRPGSSEPPGPGTNSAGLAVFRYRTPCGTVYGHTGNTLGFTQFAAATADGTRSVVVQVNAQVTPGKATEQAFARLLALEGSAVCAALAP